jgi:hypothetical protein
VRRRRVVETQAGVPGDRAQFGNAITLIEPGGDVLNGSASDVFGVFAGSGGSFVPGSLPMSRTPGQAEFIFLFSRRRQPVLRRDDFFEPSFPGSR